jgi:hypothetical protein
MRAVQGLWLWAALALLTVATAAPAEDANRPCLDDPGAACLAAAAAALVFEEQDNPDAERAYRERVPWRLGYVLARSGRDADARQLMARLEMEPGSGPPEGYRGDPEFLRAAERAAEIGGIAGGFADAGRHELAWALAAGVDPAAVRAQVFLRLSSHYIVSGDSERALATHDAAMSAVGRIHGAIAALIDRLLVFLVPSARESVLQQRAGVAAAATAYRRLRRGDADGCAAIASVPSAFFSAEFAVISVEATAPRFLLNVCEPGLPAGTFGLNQAESVAFHWFGSNALPARFSTPEAASVFRDAAFGMLRDPAHREKLMRTLPWLLGQFDPSDIQSLIRASFDDHGTRNPAHAPYLDAIVAALDSGSWARLHILLADPAEALDRSAFLGAWAHVAVLAAAEGDTETVTRILGAPRVVIASDCWISMAPNPCACPCQGRAAAGACGSRHDPDFVRMLARVAAENGHAALARGIADRVACGAEAPRAVMEVALRAGDAAMRRQAIAAAYALVDPAKRAAAFADLAAMMLAARDWGPAPGR